MTLDDDYETVEIEPDELREVPQEEAETLVDEPVPEPPKEPE